MFLGVTATLLSIFALIWNLLAGLGFGGMAWYDWLGLAIFMFVLVLQGWGMVSIFISVDNPSPQENFRAWRINFLGGFVAAFAQVLVYQTWLILNKSPYSMFMLLGGLLLCGAASWMLIVFLKGWWYNFDPEGAERLVPLDWFARDTELYEDQSDDAEEVEEAAEDTSDDEGDLFEEREIATEEEATEEWGDNW